MNHSSFSGAAAAIAAIALSASFVSGCLAVKTEHEVKPIHITMDVNLKVDKELEKSLESERRAPPPGAAEAKKMLEEGLVGVDWRGYLVQRGDKPLTDEQSDTIADYNAARRAKMIEIAASTGAARADVEKRRVEKIRERLPSGQGIWYQLDDGSWTQKN